MAPDLTFPDSVKVKGVLALVIDTSAAAVTTGIVRVEAATSGSPTVEVLAERVTLNARGHAELLAPAIASCLGAVGIAPSGLNAVIAGLGPGPFTGLRVGLVTALAFADALAIATYGVCSLDAIAADCAYPGELLVAGDARRREIYWARYRNGARIGQPEVAKAESITGQLRSATAMAGAGARLYETSLGLDLLNCDYASVAGVAGCAAERLLALAPAESLTPLYLRRPDAIEPNRSKQVSQ